MYSFPSWTYPSVLAPVPHLLCNVVIELGHKCGSEVSMYYVV